jgi:hypothetical protein
MLRSVRAGATLALLVTLLSLTGCPKDEPPPPLPAPPATTAPPAPAPIPTPDPEPTASAVPSATQGKGVPGPSLKRCCDALAQNSKSAPPPNNTLMLQASQACSAAVAAGTAAPGVMGVVRGIMGGAPLPAGCQ